MKLISGLKNLSFSSQLALFSIGFTVVITGIISWVVILEAKSALKESRLKTLESNSQAQVQKIVDQMDAFEEQATFFLESDHIKNFVRNSGSETALSQTESNDKFKKYVNLFLKNYNISKISFINNGKYVYNAGPLGDTIALPKSKVDKINFLYAKPYMEKDNYCMNVFRKLEVGNQKVVIGFKLNLEDIYNSISSNSILGKKGETLLGIMDGDSVVFINPLKHDRKAAFRRKVGLKEQKAQPLIKAVSKQHGGGSGVDYNNSEVLAHWTYITKLDWGLVAKVDLDEVYAPTNTLKIKVLLVAAILIVFSIILTLITSKSMVKPIIHLKGIIEQLSQGNRVQYELDNVSENEVGQMIKASMDLANFQNNVILFTSNIAVKEFEKNKDVKINKGEIGEALLSMEENLIRVDKEDQIKRWSNEGIAKFSTIVRDFSRDTTELSFQLISEMVQYLDCHQGGLFAINKEKDKLEQLSFFAYDRQKFAEQSLEKGDGLLWQVIVEMDKIFMTKVPVDYPQISSGLGEGKAASVLLVPLIINEEIFGVIELLSFTQIESYKIDFVESVAENIAGAISAFRINERTQELLKMSQTKTKELTTQEEELRQNMEEMQATQEELERVQMEIETKGAMLTSVINHSDDTYFCLDKDYNILVANDALRERYLKDGIVIKEGDNVFKYLPEEHHDVWKERYERILTGNSFTEDMEREVGGDTIYIKVFYDPVINDNGQVVGATVRSKDMTEIVKLKMRVKVLENKNRS